MSLQLGNQAKWKPWKGLVLFIITIVVIILGGILSEHIGLWGTLITQAVLLAMSIIVCLINDTPFKEVFPIRKPTVRDIFGAILMWIGSYGIGLASIHLAGVLLPDRYSQVTGSLNTMLTKGGVLLAFFVAVICPPICEEAITRGAILSHFRSFRKDYMTILIIGIMFGAMHTDAIRFINTFLLGSVTAYLVVKRNNILLASLVHFLQNFITGGMQILMSAFSTANSSAAAVTSQPMPPVVYLGSAMTTLCFAPVCLVLGHHLIKRQVQITKGEPKSGKLWPKLIIAIVLSLISLIIGLVLQNKYLPAYVQVK
ncbi:MAG: CPBP family intramembrane metalloprotease [Clostridiales bacterium]|nr:CPBP family intramembrane metalloprotease [Clostridiales bacterium]